jgi:hypothetical protein
MSSHGCRCWWGEPAQEANSAAQPAPGSDQILALRRARNDDTASSDVDVWVELEDLLPLSSRNRTWPPWQQAMPPVAGRGYA